MEKIISTNNMNKPDSNKAVKYLKKYYLKDAQKLGYTLSDLIDTKTRRKIIMEIERGDGRNIKKVLSERYLDDAKRLGYKWSDLIKKETREKVINEVINLRMTEASKKQNKTVKNKLNMMPN